MFHEYTTCKHVSDRFTRYKTIFIQNILPHTMSLLRKASKLKKSKLPILLWTGVRSSEASSCFKLLSRTLSVSYAHHAMPGVCPRHAHTEKSNHFLGHNVPLIFLPFSYFIECIKVHNVFREVTFSPWLHPAKIWLWKFQTVYAGLTNLCQHSTTDLVRGVMTNERKQSALLKARSFTNSSGHIEAVMLII